MILLNGKCNATLKQWLIVCGKYMFAATGDSNKASEPRSAGF